MTNLQTNKTITIILKRIAAYNKDKNGKLIQQREIGTGVLQCIQDDLFGLQSIFGKFDSRIRGIRDWRNRMTIIDKLTEIYKKSNDQKEEDNTLELTLDEASFLKIFLDEFPEKEGKNQPLKDFEIRTLLSISEQLK